MEENFKKSGESIDQAKIDLSSDEEIEVSSPSESKEESITPSTTQSSDQQGSDLIIHSTQNVKVVKSKNDVPEYIDLEDDEDDYMPGSEPLLNLSSQDEADQNPPQNPTEYRQRNDPTINYFFSKSDKEILGEKYVKQLEDGEYAVGYDSDVTENYDPDENDEKGLQMSSSSSSSSSNSLSSSASSSSSSSSSSSFSSFLPDKIMVIKKAPEKQKRKSAPTILTTSGSVPLPKSSYTMVNDDSALKGRGQLGMGHKGFLKQLAQIEPGENDIRQKSKKVVGGLHEIEPTDLRGEISKIPDEAQENPKNMFRSYAAQVQSGARTSTRLTFFKKKSKVHDKIAAHSGAFEKKNPHTVGQDEAHNELRKTAKAAWRKKFTGEKLVVATVGRQLELMPYPEDILEDKGLTGKISSISGIGEIKAPSPSDKTQMQSARFKLAEKIYIGREQAKQRLRTLKRSIPGLEDLGKFEGRARTASREASPARVASPSPPRTQTFFAPPPQPEPLPNFPGTYPVADKAAWVTQPLRLKPK